MPWPRDDAKLERVRALMAERELDALVVRAPDNVLYLTNFWGMKGFDACVFPREGEPVLDLPRAVCRGRRPHRLDAGRPVLRRLRRNDPRPPGLRALDLAREAASQYERVGLELSLGTQATDRMVGEPTTFPKAWFDAFPDAADATPLLERGPRGQDRAGGRADAARERDRRRGDGARAGRPAPRHDLRPGGGEWQGFVHGEGTGWNGQVELALPFSLVWSGPSIKTFTATTADPIVEDEPTLFEIWVCADGYWADHTKNLCPGTLSPRYAELLDQLTAVYDDAVAFCRPGASLAELDRRVREGIAEAGYAGQPSHPICHGIGARAHEPPYAHQAGGGEIAREHGAGDRARHLLARGRRPPARGQLPDHADGPEKLSPFPDGVVEI